VGRRAEEPALKNKTKKEKKQMSGIQHNEYNVENRRFNRFTDLAEASYQTKNKPTATTILVGIKIRFQSC
jgi:hypothetical protein